MRKLFIFRSIAGYRGLAGEDHSDDEDGYIWSSTVSDVVGGSVLNFGTDYDDIYTDNRGYAQSVRCIQD